MWKRTNVRTSLKKTILILICLFITLGFCACSRGSKTDLGSKIKSAVKEDPAGEKDDNEKIKSKDKKPTETKSSKNKDRDKNDPVTIAVHNLVCKSEEGEELVTGTYPEIRIPRNIKKEYPKLASTIEKKNGEWSEEVRTAVETYGMSKLEDNFGDEYGPYSSELTAELKRFDDRLFSVEITYYDYAGGAHPSHGTNVLNIDPVTGNKLAFKDVLADTDDAPKIIKEKVYAEYPDLIEEIESYSFREEDDNTDEFEKKLEDDSYTWLIAEDGLRITFSPYEIATYAAGYIEILLKYDEYPDLVQKAYKIQQNRSAQTAAKKKELEPESITLDASAIPKEAVELPNPTWERFYDTVYEYPNAKHIKLTKLSEKKSDWLDVDTWAADNGFERRLLPYADDDYYYEPASPVQYDYMYNELKIYDKNKEKLLYDFDMHKLINGPDEKEGKSSAVTQYIRWAQMYKDILYVAVGHNSYASSEPDTGYIVAINPTFEFVIWRSEPLVSNALNFKIVGDTIICGYGFTAEDDFIYLLDLYTGEKIDKIKVNSGPDQFEIVGDTLYVATYNTAYTFRIE